jgi:S1-C subfamily serine protease
MGNQSQPAVRPVPGQQKGDVITEIGNHPIPDAATLVNLSRRIAPGQQVRVRFVRDGQTQETAVIL